MYRISKAFQVKSQTFRGGYMLQKLVGPGVALILFIVLLVLGFASGQAGWLLIGLLCAWPFLWAASAWTFRGLRDTYQLVPKTQNRGIGRRQPYGQESESLS
jgi:hypothetical protein